jgi:hypothetical protein
MTEVPSLAASSAPRVERVVVVPLSGFVNRLQAMASSAILAEQLGAEFLVCWQRAPAADVDASDVLDPAFCNDHVITPTQVHALCGVDPPTMPNGLHRRGPVLTLAGHDRGEQAFMGDVATALTSPSPPATLVIRAGGKFFLPGHLDDTSFRVSRQQWYRTAPLHPDIVSTAREIASAHSGSLGLHLRYTDRSHQVPTTRRIQHAVRRLAEQTGGNEILLASDTRSKRDAWAARVRRLGVNPWFAEHAAMDRSSVAGARGALTDFLLLGSTSGMVFFSASSFGEEAAVASGAFDRSIGLPASPVMTAWAQTRTLVGAAVTYPARHGWWS